jgi:thiosulfate dehydrogenase
LFAHRRLHRKVQFFCGRLVSTPSLAGRGTQSDEPAFQVKQCDALGTKRRANMKSFVVGLIVGLLILPLAFGVYVASGRMPVATSDPPMPFEADLAEAGLYARIRREAPTRDVSGDSTQELLSGAGVYQKNCAFCHGLPGQPVPPVGQGESPKPPQLFTEDGRVSDDPAGVTYWKVKNGIRLTAMPGFQASLGDQQIWQVTALVARADKLPPEVLDALKPGPPVILVTAGAANPAAATAPGGVTTKP